MSGVRRYIIALALASIAWTAAAAEVPPDFKARADAYLKSAYPADGPGAAVIVTDDGKLVYAGGQGLADLDAKTPITPGTVFRIGSITKQFSAAVILQLVAEGKLSLDDRLSKFLADYPKPGADATVAQLLNHTVGVQSYTSISGWMVEAKTARPYTTAELIAEFKDMPAPDKPGEKWSYNNSGYVLVGAIIEAVTGKPWHQAVEERIARPLGLATIRYGVGEERTPNMAKGYTGGENGPEPARKIHMSVPSAAGALLGSVEDLAKWAEALHHEKVLPAALYQRMTSPTVLPDGTTTPYGFGLGFEKIRGRDTIGHGGGIFGFSTDSLYIPKEGLFVAVFANSDDPAVRPGIVMQKVAAMALGEPYPELREAKADLNALEPVLGVYKSDEGERLFFARDGKLFTRRSGGSAMEVFAAGDDRFFYGPGSLTWFSVKRDAAGAHAMEMHHDGERTERSVRAGPVPAERATASVPHETLARYAGNYRSPVAPILVALDEAGSLSLKLGGQKPVPVRALGETEFEAVGVDARVVFHIEKGAVSRLVIHQGGRELPAERLAE